MQARSSFFALYLALEAGKNAGATQISDRMSAQTRKGSGRLIRPGNVDVFHVLREYPKPFLALGT